MFYIHRSFLFKKWAICDLLIPSFWWAMWAIRSGHSPKMRDLSDVSDSLRSLTKNEQRSELLGLLSKSLIRSFLSKKRAIRSENRWANSQRCVEGLSTNTPIEQGRELRSSIWEFYNKSCQQIEATFCSCHIGPTFTLEKVIMNK